MGVTGRTVISACVFWDKGSIKNWQWLCFEAITFHFAGSFIELILLLSID